MNERRWLCIRATLAAGVVWLLAGCILPDVSTAAPAQAEWTSGPAVGLGDSQIWANTLD